MNLSPLGKIFELSVVKFSLCIGIKMKPSMGLEVSIKYSPEKIKYYALQ